MTVNTAFIVKMIKAKKLEYEAFKELAPECLRARIDSCERETAEALKAAAADLFMNGMSTEKPQDSQSGGKTKKVDIDFG